MTASAQLDGRIDWYSTFAALIAQNPSSSVLIGTIANTTDQGPVVNTANGWVVQSNVPAANAVNNLVVQRQANIANFMSGAAIAAPNWAASTAYAAGQSVTLPSGPIRSRLHRVGSCRTVRRRGLGFTKQTVLELKSRHPR